MYIILNWIILVNLLMLPFCLEAQFTQGDALFVGTSFGYAFNGAAYGYQDAPGKVLDLPYYGDRFSHLSGRYQYAAIGDQWQLEADAQMIGILLFFMDATVKNWNEKPVRVDWFPGTGKFRSIERHLSAYNLNPDSSLQAFGTDYTFFQADVLRIWPELNRKSMRFGLNIGIHGLGGNQDGQRTKTLSNAQNLRYLANKIFWTLGPSASVAVNDNIMLFARFNGLLARKRNGITTFSSRSYGIELFPSARVTVGGKVGLFLEAFAKYRWFSSQTGIFLFPQQGAPTIEKQIRVPSFMSLQVGISAGCYLNFSR